MKELEFTITFWIKADKNPGWCARDTDINFPPVTIQGGVRIFSSKFGRTFKVYILHPEHGYRKLTADMTKFIGADTFVAVTVKGRESKLYLNAELVSSMTTDEMIKNIEPGDYVIVNTKQGDLKKIQVGTGIQLALVAEVKKVKGNSLLLNFFDLNEIVELPVDRLIY